VGWKRREVTVAKRFTDSNKWSDPWFCSLSKDDKLFWTYLLDNCDHAGIWKVNIPLLEFYIPEYKVNMDVFKDRIVILDGGGHWFIEKFVLFQQKINSINELKDENKCHLGIKRILAARGLIKMKGARKGLQSPTGIGIGKGNISNTTNSNTQEVIRYFNELTGSHLKETNKELSEIINARLKDSFSVEDCKTVIRKKWEVWKDDEKMCKYVRINTLFRPSHFDEYLNEKEANSDIPAELRHLIKKPVSSGYKR
jgi:uncharacterized phage protein (TIGR02220 family)